MNSVHGIRLNPDVPYETARLLPLAALNTLTLLGAELVGRAYGGGLLKLEPREAERVPVPMPETVLANEAGLRAIASAGAHERLSAGGLWEVVAAVDDLLLGDFDTATRRLLEHGRERLARRRASRGKARPSSQPVS